MPIIDKNIRYLISTFILSVVMASAYAPLEAKTEKPNILFILVDDLGWKDLGVAGSTFYETPQIDLLARSGVYYRNAYSSHPVCSPTRAAIMTGRKPERLHITDWIPGVRPKDRALLGPDILNQLPHSERTMAEYLQADGYQTFYAGKWHLGGEGYLPTDQGFDINKGGFHVGQPQRTKTDSKAYYSPYNNPYLDDGPDGEYLTERLTNETISFIKGRGDKPFFAFLSYYNVHTPIEAAPARLSYYQKKSQALKATQQGPSLRKEGPSTTKIYQDQAEYATMVSAVDDHVGRLVNTLRQEGLLENTVIIFTSDNGGLSTNMRRDGFPTSNEPSRAGKGWIYEGGIRVPLIISGAGIEGNKARDDVVESTDLFSTVLSVAGITPDPDIIIDGRDIVSDGGGERANFWHYPHYHGSGWSPGSGVRLGDWKLIKWYEGTRTELYNLKDDPSEQHNLIGSEPKKAKELTAILEQWLIDVDASMPTKQSQK